MQEMPELTEIDGVKEEGTQQVVLTIDREAAQRLGVNMNTVASMLNNSFSQRQVSTMYEEMNQYRVVMELEPGFALPAILARAHGCSRLVAWDSASPALTSAAAAFGGALDVLPSDPPAPAGGGHHLKEKGLTDRERKELQRLLEKEDE